MSDSPAEHLGDLAFEEAPHDQATALAWLARHGLDACEYDDRSPVERALSQIRPSVQNTDAGCLAVRAALDQLSGNVSHAVELYERARLRAVDPELRRRIDENYALILHNRHQTMQADQIVDDALAERDDDPIFLGIRALIRARLKRNSARTDIERMEKSALLTDLGRARSYVRASYALNDLGNRRLSEEYAHRAAQIGESIGAHKYASSAYLLLLSMYSNDANLAAARSFATLAADAAFKAGDQVFRYAALVHAYELAVEAGEEDTAKDLRTLIGALRSSARFHEAALALADAMRLAWEMRYDEMRQRLSILAGVRLNGPQQALHRALLALANLGCDDEEQALRGAYAAIAVGKPNARDSVLEARLRLLGRIIAGGVLLHAERKAEATRRLSAFQTHQTALYIRRLATALLDGDYENVRSVAPEIYGYALLFKSLSKRQEQSYRRVGLTEREVAILRQLATGETGREIASRMGLSPVTIDWHKSKILKKLGVKRTIAAVVEAKRLRIIS
jgi:DNA-binding CsgD family transcriptional regulator